MGIPLSEFRQCECGDIFQEITRFLKRLVCRTILYLMLNGEEGNSCWNYCLRAKCRHLDYGSIKQIAGITNKFGQILRIYRDSTHLCYTDMHDVWWNLLMFGTQSISDLEVAPFLSQTSRCSSRMWGVSIGPLPPSRHPSESLRSGYCTTRPVL